MTRISTSQMFALGVDAMLQKQLELSRTELQLSKGERILSPSDDPSASVRILDMNEAEAKLEQYQRNAESAQSRLEQEETALENMINLLQRVRELAVQGNNGTNGPGDRAMLAAEIREHQDSFLQLANTRDANGEYIFGGFATDAPPWEENPAGTFTYNGDSGQRFVQIGDTRQVAIGDSGDIFSLTAPSGASSISEIVHNLATSYEAGNADGDALGDLDAAMEQILSTRAQIGARMNAIESQREVNESFGVAVSDVRSKLKDLDYAEAISRFNQQLAAMQAAQQSFLKIQDLNLFNYLR